MRIEELINQNSLKYPNRIAYKDNEKSVSWKELGNIKKSSYLYMKQLNINIGDKLLLLMDNSIECILTLICIWIMEVDVIIMHRDTSQQTLDIMKSNLGIKCVIGKSRGGETYIEKDDLQCVILDERVCEHVGKERLVILKTSGTYSGKMQFVAHNRDNLIKSAYILSENLEMQYDDIIVSALPMDHILGLVSQFLISVVSGATLSFPVEKSIKAIKSCILQDAVTVLNGVPSLYKLLMQELSVGDNNKVDSLKKGVIGGDGYSPTFFVEIVNRLGISGLIPSLGSTEAGIITCGNIHESLELRAHTIGKVPGEIDYKIDRKGNLEKGLEGGELLIHTNLLATKYIEIDGTSRSVETEYWFHTDDYVLEKKRYLIYLYRKKNMIVRGGINILLKNLENLCNEIMPDMEFACIGMENKKFGEIVAVFVKESEREAFNFEYFENKLNAAVNRSEGIDVIIKLRDMPLNKNGKIDKHALRAILSEEIKNKIYLIEKERIFLNMT